MENSELLDIIKTGEEYTIEFKESINSSIGKDICAFANSSGGKITMPSSWSCEPTDSVVILSYDSIACA